jgi:hypothetical protein
MADPKPHPHFKADGSITIPGNAGPGDTLAWLAGAVRKFTGYVRVHGVPTPNGVYSPPKAATEQQWHEVLTLAGLPADHFTNLTPEQQEEYRSKGLVVHEVTKGWGGVPHDIADTVFEISTWTGKTDFTHIPGGALDRLDVLAAHLELMAPRYPGSGVPVPGRGVAATLAVARVRAIRSGAIKDVPIYPGRLMALRERSANAHPVDDDALEPPYLGPLGVSLSWARTECGDGCVRVDACGEERFAVVTVRDNAHPGTGVRRLDTWLVRADILRQLLIGRGRACGQPRLTTDEAAGAIPCLALVLRDESKKLLKIAPPQLQLTALARVVNMDPPDRDIIDAAMSELVAVAPRWEHAPAVEPPPGGRNGKVPFKPEGWTKKELCHDTCSSSTFDSIRRAAEVKAAKEGDTTRRYSVAEVRCMAKVAPTAASRLGSAIVEQWLSLIGDTP